MNSISTLISPSELPPTAESIHEEFFEDALFQDILGMKSIPQVAEKTAYDLKELQDDVYQALFALFQKTRGIATPSSTGSDDIFLIFETLFKGFYQHFRQAMEAISQDQPPVKVAYVLGKNSDKLLKMLDQFIQEINKELS
ncbi:MAG TPA: hypothetical protein PLC07_12280 [Bacillota bacterium]|nr:hypothetical protein [Bacillota bacterium]HPT88486.1 hypothetical protein [Bacillota bacterium]